jgi:hypothetical protein
MNGTNGIKTYCITFYAQSVNLLAFTQYLYDSADIVAYWNYIPLVYCVKSRLNSTQLTAKLRSFFPVQGYLVAEINVQNINGVLPKEAWDWFYLDHHEKSRPPSFPPGLFGFTALGTPLGLPTPPPVPPPVTKRE